MLSPHKILLVEDNSMVQTAIESLISPYYRVTSALNLSEAEKHLQKDSFSLMLLDVQLPDGDGFSFCRKVRHRYEELLIIFLTGQSDLQDRVRGFEDGGDDYITKPFEPQELLARIEGKLKRRESMRPQSTFQKGIFFADLSAQKISIVETNGQKQDVPLTPIEFKLLMHFLKNEGKVFSRETLRSAVWGNAVHISTHTIDVHISSLRKKIGGAGKPLKAIVRQGYCFAQSEKAS